MCWQHAGRLRGSKRIYIFFPGRMNRVLKSCLGQCVLWAVLCICVSVCGLVSHKFGRQTIFLYMLSWSKDGAHFTGEQQRSVVDSVKAWRRRLPPLPLNSSPGEISCLFIAWTEIILLIHDLGIPAMAEGIRFSLYLFSIFPLVGRAVSCAMAEETSLLLPLPCRRPETKTGADVTEVFFIAIGEPLLSVVSPPQWSSLVACCAV